MGLTPSKHQFRPAYPLPVPGPGYPQNGFNYNNQPTYFINPGQINKGNPPFYRKFIFSLNHPYLIRSTPEPQFQGPVYPNVPFQSQPVLPFPQPQTFQPPPFIPQSSSSRNPNSYRRDSTSTRRYSATPYPTAFPEPVIEPQPQILRQSQPQPPVERPQHIYDMRRALEPLENANASVFGPPGPRPLTPISNPLPPPPRDIYDTSPYRAIMNLPHTAALLTSTFPTTITGPPQTNSVPVGRKKSHKGLFPSLSLRRKREETPSVSFVPVFIPQAQSQPNPPPTTSVPAFNSVPAPPAPPPPPSPSTIPPVKFDERGPLAGFMNHSPHRVMYQHKTYPTAHHLYEALKFINHRPDIAEQIRTCAHVHDVYPLSVTFHEFQRPDWGEVFLKTVRQFFLRISRC